MGIKIAAGRSAWPSYAVGDYLSTPFAATQNSAMVDGRADFTPVYLGRPTTIDQLGLRVITAIAATAIRVAVYRDNGAGRPGKLVVEAPSTIDSTTTGGKTVNLTAGVLLQPGVYWLVGQAEGGAPTVTATTNVSAFAVSQSTTNVGINGWRVTHTGAFASDMAGASYSIKTDPVIIYARTA